MSTLSIVIPTHNRVALLRKCFEGLLDAPLSVEIIVSDDGSTDSTSEFVHDLMTRHTNIVYVGGRQSGPAAARNRGWRASSREIVAFLDDDCVPEAGWAEQILAEFSTHPEIAGIEGKTLPADEGPPPGTFMHSIDSFPRAFLTCNLAVRRTALVAVNGLDEGFPYPACEDIDLCLRIEKAVGPIMFSDRIRVRHGRFAIGARYYFNRVRYEPSQYRLFARHPELLRDLIETSKVLRRIGHSDHYGPGHVAMYLVYMRLHEALAALRRGGRASSRIFGGSVLVSAALLTLLEIPDGIRQWRKAASIGVVNF